MKNSKKIVTLLLALAMAASAAGCANTGSAGDENSSGKLPSEPEETANLIWYIVGAGKSIDHDMVMEDVNPKIKEKINATLDLRCLGWGEFQDRMKMIINSNEDYDMCFTSDWTNSFTDNVSKDAYLDITDLYQEYGKDIASQVPEWLLDAGKSGGKLYAIPNQQMVAYQSGVGLQKQLIDKYNLNVEDLKTFDGLEKIMDVIVENEPDLIPISLLDNYIVRISKYESFANNLVFIKKGDDTFSCVGTDVASEEDLRLRNEWYKKGYIREDIATNSDESPYFASNKFAILLNNYAPGGDAQYEASYGIPYVGSATGLTADEKPYVGATAGASTMTAISVNSKNPIAAMKLLNLVHADKDIYNELVSGLEGVHYEKTGENSMKLLFKEDGSQAYTYPDWEIGNVFNGYLLPGKDEDAWEQTDKMNRESEMSPLRGFSFDPSNVQSEMAQVSAVLDEFKNMEYVTDDIDQMITDRTAKLKSAGLDRIVEEVQSQIDAWAAENGK